MQLRKAKNMPVRKILRPSRVCVAYPPRRDGIGEQFRLSRLSLSWAQLATVKAAGGFQPRDWECDGRDPTPEKVPPTEYWFRRGAGRRALNQPVCGLFRPPSSLCRNRRKQFDAGCRHLVKRNWLSGFCSVMSWGGSSLSGGMFGPRSPPGSRAPPRPPVPTRLPIRPAALRDSSWSSTDLSACR